MRSYVGDEKARVVLSTTWQNRGFALIASLIVLAMLALLGAASMTATNTEIRISSSMADAARSFHAAEAGLDAGHVLLRDDLERLTFTGDSNPLDFTLAPGNYFAHLAADEVTRAFDDAPSVTALVSGDPKGECARSKTPYSRDLIGCGAFELASTHTSGGADQSRNRVETTLLLGVDAPYIKN